MMRSPKASFNLLILIIVIRLLNSFSDCPSENYRNGIKNWQYNRLYTQNVIFALFLARKEYSTDNTTWKNSIRYHVRHCKFSTYSEKKKN